KGVERIDTETLLGSKLENERMHRVAQRRTKRHRGLQPGHVHGPECRRQGTSGSADRPPGASLQSRKGHARVRECKEGACALSEAKSASDVAVGSCGRPESQPRAKALTPTRPPHRAGLR